MWCERKIYEQRVPSLSQRQQGRRKRRISTNRIHLCPSSALPNKPVWDVEWRSRPRQSPCQGGEVRNILSQAQTPSHRSPLLGEGERAGMQESSAIKVFSCFQCNTSVAHLQPGLKQGRWTTQETTEGRHTQGFPS